MQQGDMFGEILVAKSENEIDTSVFAMFDNT